MAPFDERYDGFADTISENGDGFFRGVGGFFSMTNSINRSDQNSVLVATNQMVISRLTVTGKCKLGDAVLHHRHCCPPARLGGNFKFVHESPHSGQAEPETSRSGEAIAQGLGNVWNARTMI